MNPPETNPVIFRILAPHLPAIPATELEVEVDPINIQFFPAPSDHGSVDLSPPHPASATAEPNDLTRAELVRFAADDREQHAPMTLAGLGPNEAEIWCDSEPTKPISYHGAVTQFTGRQGPTLTFLSACVKVTKLADVRQITFDLYRELLEAMASLEAPRFVRIWNYIPEINAGTGDNECYRQFCWGRADALGTISLPAATGIGSRDGWLRVSALCTGPEGRPDSIGIRHLENARQLSAYNYPREYGPRSPSFARATLVSPATGRSGQSLLLVSGTSSIVHHQTLHAGNIAAQTAETVRNIQTLLMAPGGDSRTPLPADSNVDFDPVPLAIRYYLRNSADLPQARSSWTANAGHWPAPAWYEADICRSDLAMEVEAVFSV